MYTLRFSLSSKFALLFVSLRPLSILSLSIYLPLPNPFFFLFSLSLPLLRLSSGVVGGEAAQTAWSLADVVLAVALSLLFSFLIIFFSPPNRSQDLFYYIPQAALAAIIITSVVTMIDYEAAIDMFRVNKLDLLPFAVSFFGSLFLGIEYGVLAAVGLNILYLLFFAARCVCGEF